MVGAGSPGRSGVVEGPQTLALPFNQEGVIEPWLIGCVCEIAGTGAASLKVRDGSTAIAGLAAAAMMAEWPNSVKHQIAAVRHLGLGSHCLYAVSRDARCRPSLRRGTP